MIIKKGLKQNLAINTQVTRCQNLNSLHLKRSEDCNLNLITVGKLNTEVNSYVPF
jgi:hypothetical protein